MSIIPINKAYITSCKYNNAFATYNWNPIFAIVPVINVRTVEIERI